MAIGCRTLNQFVNGEPCGARADVKLTCKHGLDGMDQLFARNGLHPVAGGATVEVLQEQKPDVLLLELFLGRCDGLFLIEELAARFPDTRILVITKQAEEVFAERALRAGCADQLPNRTGCSANFTR